MTRRPPLRDKSILVTGGAGFIGSHLVDSLLAAQAREIVVVDNLFVGCETNLTEAVASGRVIFYKDDAEFATTLEYIFENHDIDVVFNCATKALNYSFLNPSNAFSTNVAIALNLLELQRRGAFQTLCHFSSSEVYGSAIYEPMDEKHPCFPTTTYAAGKAAADHAVFSYAKMFGLDSFIVRPFNNYGPRQNCTGRMAAIIPLTAQRILNGIAPEVHGSGDQTRDFIYVQDTVDATLKLYEVLEAGESVNLATDNQVAIRDLVAMICDMMGYNGEVVQKPARKSDVFCHNASNEKLKSLVDVPLTPFPEGLARTLQWYRDQQPSADGRVT